MRLLEGRLDRIGGAFFLGVSAMVCLSYFWSIGRAARDAIVLTAYVTQIGRGQQQAFGYGGEGAGERVDVAFQGREMSNVSFLISRDREGRYRVAGRDDEIRLRRMLYPAGQPAEFGDGDTFVTQGPLGRAAFTAHVEGDRLRLSLTTPLFRDIGPAPTRLVIGWMRDPVLSPRDEVFLRTPSLPGPSARMFLVWVEKGGLHMEPERDLAKLGEAAPRGAATPGGGNGGSEEAKCGEASQPYLMRPGEVCELGTLEFSFQQYAADPNSSISLNSIRIWGGRLCLALCCFGLAFLIGPQARWPPGAVTVFGCATLITVAGLILTARDLFLQPHQQRFGEYLGGTFWAVLALFAARVPFSPEAIESERGFYARLALAFLFVAAGYFLMLPSTGGAGPSWASLLLSALKLLIGFVLLLIASLAVQVFARTILADFFDAPWDIGRFRFWVLTPLLISVLGLLLVRYGFGGREALTVAGLRIHLPTLMLPLVVLWTSILVWAAEANVEGREAWSALLAAAAFSLILVYRLLSSDNGGSAVLAIGVLSALWLGCRGKGLPLVVTALVLAGGLLLAWWSQSARFELAWGAEGRVLYYDAAKNLRLARDMARAGGPFGLSVALPVPAEMRSNLHNDLVVAYVTGFFGWLIAATLFVAYAIIYNYLFGSLYKSVFGVVSASAVTDTSLHGLRLALLRSSAALVLTFAAQALWVIMANLLYLVPFTGLDLQPISASTISILSFFVVLLGSAGLVLTLNQTLPE